MFTINLHYSLLNAQCSMLNAQCIFPSYLHYPKNQILFYHEKCSPHSHFFLFLNPLLTFSQDFDTDNQTAMDYYNKGQYAEAVVLFEKWLIPAKEELGDHDTATYASLLSWAATCYEYSGQYDKALPMYEKALQIHKDVSGEQHPTYATSLNNLALLYESMGNYEKALPLLEEAGDILIGRMKTAFGFLPEQEKQKQLDDISWNFAIYNSFYAKNIDSSPSISTLSFNNELFLKGALLNSSNLLRENILNSGDTGLIRSYETWIGLRQQIAYLYTLPVGERYTDVGSLEEKAGTMERELMQHSPAFKQAQSELRYTYEDVIQNLEPGEAIIEFVSFRYHNGKEWTDSTLYVALIARPGYAYPAFITLFEEEQLAVLMGVNVADSLRGVTLFQGSPGKNDTVVHQFYQLIWKPLEEYLSGVTEIYITPSGLLNKVSFAQLLPDDSTYLLDRYELHYVLSSRDIISKKAKSKEQRVEIKSENTAALFGGAEFGMSMEGMQLQAEAIKVDPDAQVYRSLPDNAKCGGVFQPLPNTLTEVYFINGILNDKGWSISLNAVTTAIETRVKSLSGESAPRVLHIATHGFFCPAPENKDRDRQLMISGENPFRYSENPLMRTGLALSGANHAWSGEEITEGIDDGILTAYEVSNLDLRRTELVVLSACETGLGDIQGGEGVFGLQGAFRLAGAGNILMSLWSVPDKETRELMELFYTNWMTGMDIDEAFRQAQQVMRNNYPFSPEKWAAFVMVE
jgi:CHAT domain-containing protein/tetratricopeptide (TPR) repeat protein